MGDHRNTAEDDRSAGTAGRDAGGSTGTVLRQLFQAAIVRSARRSATCAAEMDGTAAWWTAWPQEARAHADRAGQGHAHDGSQAVGVPAMRDEVGGCRSRALAAPSR